ncbi:MAG: sugar-binding transcriptional regulator [Candidatus Humimicrobiia bacterium]
MVIKELLYKILKLYYHEHLKQKEIAEKLSISRFKVSRYLNKALNEGIVKILINYPENVVSFSDLENKIEKKIGLKECIVVQTADDIEEIYKKMAVRLVDLLERYVRIGDYIGISWGSTLKGVVDHIDIIKNMNIKVVPMVGGVGKIGKNSQTTNIVAKILADKFGGINFMIHAPAVLNSVELKKVFLKEPHINKIFKIINRIRIALVGISDIGSESNLLKTGVFIKEQFDYLRKKGVVGDVNLIFIDRKGEQVVTDLDDRLINFNKDDLKKIENVVGIAFGERKAEAIISASIGKIINILITDNITAKRILKLLNRKDIY